MAETKTKTKKTTSRSVSSDTAKKSPAKKSPAKATGAKKSPAKTTGAKKSPAKTPTGAKKPAAEKPAATSTSAAKKPAAKKPAAKATSAAKKPAAKKPAAKTTSEAKKPAAKTTGAKKPAAKTASAKKPAAKTASAKKPAAKTTSAKKPAAKTTSVVEAPPIDGQQLRRDEAAALAKLVAAAGLDKKAERIEIIDITEKVDYADYLVLMSGRSDRQVQSIAGGIEEALKAAGHRPAAVEGMSPGHWVIVDYGDVIVHVFQEEARRYYDLDSLWLDARRVPFESAARASVPPSA